MDQALRLLGRLKNQLVGDEELLRAAWKAAVGDRIEAQIERLTGRSMARQIEYRLAIPRPGPKVEIASDFRLAAQDQEAAGIADPGLRRVYLRSKKRAGGR